MTMADSSAHHLISGRTHHRTVFRPGDWAERLMGVVILFVGERRPGIHVAAMRLAMPVVDAGVKCLIVSGERRSVCPEAFEFVVRFAEDNDLPVEVRFSPGDRAARPVSLQLSESRRTGAARLRVGRAIGRTGRGATCRGNLRSNS